jgi:hypothetical protein
VLHPCRLLLLLLLPLKEERKLSPTVYCSWKEQALIAQSSLGQQLAAAAARHLLIQTLLLMPLLCCPYCCCGLVCGLAAAAGAD